MSEKSADKLRGLYLVIEGQDGTGKTTQIERLAEAIRDEITVGKTDTARNPHHFTKVVMVNENALIDSGLPATDELAKIIKNKDFQLDPLDNVMLLTTARRELWLKIIAPTLQQNGIVVSSRNWWSTLAYQGFGQGVRRSYIEEITRHFLPERYVEPDVGVILKLDDVERAKRSARPLKDDEILSREKDTFESAGNDFLARVNRGYEQLAQDLNVPLVDTSGTVEETFDMICSILNL